MPVLKFPVFIFILLLNGCCGENGENQNVHDRYKGKKDVHNERTESLDERFKQVQTDR